MGLLDLGCNSVQVLGGLQGLGGGVFFFWRGGSL